MKGMSTSQFWQLEHLSNPQLAAGLERVVTDARRSTGELIAYLGEVEERRLHLLAACGSMFEFCVERLGFSEDEACRRIEAARLARRFPVLFSLLAEGKLSLSVVALLKPYIDTGNAEDLLAGVSGRSVRKAKEFLAARFPVPDVPSAVRKLPEHASPKTVDASPKTVDPSPKTVEAHCQNPETTPDTRSASSASVASGEPGEPGEPLRASPHLSALPRERPQLTPLSSDRYAIRFTASKELVDKLERARDLLRHAIPSGDFAPIFERALDLLLADLAKRRFGRAQTHTALRDDTREQPNAKRTRHIPRAARRQVAERDGLQCSWTDETGRRCAARAWLEYDHRQPFARGGAAAPEDLRLLCRAHNRLEAERAYGRAHMDRSLRKPPQPLRDSRQASWAAAPS
jgi:hypothetical protein